ncbi:LysE family translocator [Hyphomonas pacifica]|uniref:Lysine transporter LysE n=2 Tax=Hyphomonas pacifica TaxID=1280941 RepID=A0A062TN76_9PROT|nr:LysE family translocator [Hyphomonas pacifica]KCZ46204.1 hypothetical protein HY2_05855 [Hyphomonas pacifica]RAN31519.1 hypothetical protein HY11_07065 [Hyphomonas pacifica]RAN35806.1 hypothetical protein HY3_06830 [Hyphomonas pacifica]
MLSNVDWPAFLIAMAAVELTPGPNMGWLAALSAQRGRRVGLTAVVGVTIGLFVQILAAATGLSAALSEMPVLYEGLRWAGVAFMLYLAVEAWRDTGIASPLQRDSYAGFRRGLIANLLNPKALVFYLVIVGQFANEAYGPLWMQIILLGLIHLAVAVTVHVAIVLAGDRLGATLERYRKDVWVRGAFALTLASIAVWIAFSTGRPS